MLSPGNADLKLSVRNSGAVTVHGLTEVYIKSPEECMELGAIRQQCPPGAHIVTTVAVEESPNRTLGERSVASSLRAGIMATLSFVSVAPPPPSNRFVEGRSVEERPTWLAAMEAVCSEFLYWLAVASSCNPRPCGRGR